MSEQRTDITPDILQKACVFYAKVYADSKDEALNMLHGEKRIDHQRVNDMAEVEFIKPDSDVPAIAKQLVDAMGDKYPRYNTNDVMSDLRVCALESARHKMVALYVAKLAEGGYERLADFCRGMSAVWRAGYPESCILGHGVVSRFGEQTPTAILANLNIVVASLNNTMVNRAVHTKRGALLSGEDVSVMFKTSIEQGVKQDYVIRKMPEIYLEVGVALLEQLIMNAQENESLYSNDVIAQRAKRLQLAVNKLADSTGDARRVQKIITDTVEFFGDSSAKTGHKLADSFKPHVLWMSHVLCFSLLVNFEIVLPESVTGILRDEIHWLRFGGE